MDLGLHDKVYVVTGASRGLGFAAARELAADGAKVLLTGRQQQALDAAVDSSAVSPPPPAWSATMPTPRPPNGSSPPRWRASAGWTAS